MKFFGGKKQNKEEVDEIKNNVITKETLGMTLGVFCILAFLMLCTDNLIFGQVGRAINSFLLGLFGFYAYVIILSLLYLSVCLVVGRNFLPSKQLTIWLFCFLGMLDLVIHVFTTASLSLDNYGEYIAACFTAAKNGIIGATGGGAIAAIIDYLFMRFTTLAGAYILLFAGLGLCGYCTVVSILKELRIQPRILKKKVQEDNKEVAFSAIDNTRPQNDIAQEKKEDIPSNMRYNNASTVQNDNSYSIDREYNRGQVLNASNPSMDNYNQNRKILYNQEDPTAYRQRNLIFDANSKYNTRPEKNYNEEYTSNFKPSNKIDDFTVNASENKEERPYSKIYTDELDNRISYSGIPKKILTEDKGNISNGYSLYKKEEQSLDKEEKIDNQNLYNEENNSVENNDFLKSQRENDFIQRESETSNFENEEPRKPIVEKDIEQNKQEFKPNLADLFSADNKRLSQENLSPKDSNTREDSFVNLFEEEPSSNNLPPINRRERGILSENTEKNEISTNPFDSIINNAKNNEEDKPPISSRMNRLEPKKEEDEKPVNSPKPYVHHPYMRPNLTVFEKHTEVQNIPIEEIDFNKESILETLSAFRIQAEIAKVTCGPTFTRYDISIPKNVAARKIITLSEDITMNLHAKDKVNVFPNFLNGTVAIDVANQVRTTVGMDSMVASEGYMKAKPNSLTFCVGKDVEGNCICRDIVKMKHLLVAGATGSGKSVFLNELIVSLIMKYSPEELRLILVDPKQVEFMPYSRLPHLLINEIISQPSKVVSALNWAINEMEHRYNLFSQLSAKGLPTRNLDEYNAGMSKPEDKMPRILIIIDEVADLMMTSKKEIEDKISRLAAKARAAGIHVVVATQRPSVDVITGIIKANLPTRIAFHVFSEIDSRTILDDSGAENLLGNGDMLIKSEDSYTPHRVQGAFITSEEVQRVVNYVSENNEAYYDPSVAEYINNNGKSSPNLQEDSDEEIEPVYIDALRFVVQTGSASISMIQRKCSVGYNKAGKIVEWMEQMGYISPFEGAKARKVLLTKEEFEQTYGDL